MFGKKKQQVAETSGVHIAGLRHGELHSQGAAQELECVFMYC